MTIPRPPHDHARSRPPTAADNDARHLAPVAAAPRRALLAVTALAPAPEGAGAGVLIGPTPELRATETGSGLPPDGPAEPEATPRDERSSTATAIPGRTPQRQPRATGARARRRRVGAAASQGPIDPRLLRHARTSRPGIAVLAVLGAGQAGATVLVAVALTLIIAAPRWWALGLLAGAYGLRSVLSWAEQVVAVRTAARVTDELRRRMLSILPRRGPAWVADFGSGRLTALLTNGLDALRPWFSGYLPSLVLGIALPPLVIVAMAVVDPASALIALATLPLIPVLGALIGWATQAQARRRWQADARLAGHFLDVVQGLPTLRVFGRADRQSAVIADLTDRHRRATLRVLRVAFLSSTALDLVGTLSVGLIAVEAGLRVAAGHLPLAPALLVILLAPEAYRPLREMAARYHAATDATTVITDVDEILSPTTTPTPTSPPAPASIAMPARLSTSPPPPTKPSAPARLTTSPPPPTEFAGPAGRSAHASRSPRPGVAGRTGPVGLTASGVRARYPGAAADALVLPTLTVAPGEIVALRGPSGAGKTTALRVLAGLHPATEGSVRVPDALYLPQRPTLPHARTVADLFPRADATIALASVGLARDLTPDTPLGERGTGVSAGQRHRLALAALLHRAGRSPATLLLDEPTAHLDADTERLVITRLREAAANGSAVLVVAHRPALLTAADRIVDLTPPTPSHPAAAISQAAVPPAAQDQPRPAPATQDQPAPPAATHYEPTPTTTIQDQPATAPATHHRPAPTTTTQDQPATAPATHHRPAPTTTTQDQPAPPAATRHQPAPASATATKTVVPAAAGHAARRRVSSWPVAVALGSGSYLAGLLLTGAAAWLLVRAATVPPVLTLSAAVVLVRGSAVARPLLRYVERLVAHDVAFARLGARRARVYAALVPRTPGPRLRRRGDLLARVVDDVDTRVDGLLRGRLPALTAAVTLTVATVVAVAVAPAVAIPLAVGLVVAGVVAPALAARQAARDDAATAAARTRLRDAMVETVDGIEELRGGSRVPEERSRTLARLESRAAQAAGRAAALAHLGWGVAVTGAAWALTHASALSPEWTAVVLLAVVALGEPVLTLPDAATARRRDAGAAARLAELTSTPAPATFPVPPTPSHTPDTPSPPTKSAQPSSPAIHADFPQAPDTPPPHTNRTATPHTARTPPPSRAGRNRHGATTPPPANRTATPPTAHPTPPPPTNRIATPHTAHTAPPPPTDVALFPTTTAGSTFRSPKDDMSSFAGTSEDHTAEPAGNAPRIGSLSLRGVDAGWDPRRAPALRGLDLDLPAGARVAVVGRSGSGKSTLGAVVARLLDPRAGSIMAGGRDLCALAEEEVRGRIVLVGDETGHVFASSVRENLRLARPSATDDELRAVLERVRLDGWLAGLPDGLDTWLGTGGTTMSGGQARRLATARALLADPEVLILDEPTEGLDTDLAEALMADLLDAAAGHTVLLLTHRTEGLDRVDRVVRLPSPTGDHTPNAE